VAAQEFVHSSGSGPVVDPSRELPMVEARELVKEFEQPTAWIYWADMLFYAVLGWGAFAVTLMLPDFHPLQLLTLAVSGLALYRAAIFIHELAHLKRGTFTAFRWVWNFVAGFPLLVPSFLYTGVHGDHHKTGIYGSAEDGEYVPYGLEPRWKIVLSLVTTPLLPLILIVRFLILGPISHLHRKLELLLWRRLSSLVIDFAYVRPAPSERDGTTWRAEEALTTSVIAGAMLALATGVMPWRVFIAWYVVGVIVLGTNAVRTVIAHRYRNTPERHLTVSQQFLDSVDVPGNLFLTALWAPVGLRYHATHHLFPYLPYHNLGAAHRKLARELSAKDLYLEATEPNLKAAFKTLWDRSAA
jgi:fatty acid desaturase